MNSDLTSKQKLIIQAVSKGMPIEKALISLGYSDNSKSIHSQITRLNKNSVFCEEMRKAQEKILEDKMLADSITKEKLIAEYYEYYQQLRANDDPSNALKALGAIKEMHGFNADKTKQIEHKHSINFENLLSDMKKGIEEKPIISIN